MKLRPFELGLVMTFGVLALVALFLMRTYEPKPDDSAVIVSGPVTIWGTLPATVFSQILGELSETYDSYRNVSYRYIAPESFDRMVVDALADQNPPDILLMSHERMVKHRSRLQSIPYESFPVRDFRNRYIDGAGIFALNDGVYAFPVAVDPLVMYWNRDTLSTNGFLTPPATWEEIVNEVAPALTKRDFNRTIQKSAVAMGEYTNIKNSFPIISMLLIQSGSNLVSESGSQYRVNLNTSAGSTAAPLTTALTFFTSFSNVNNSLYGWNRSLSLDRDMFLREDLALYFGFGSEGRELEAKNPNLSFDIAEVPQGENVVNKRTYGNFYGLFVLKAAKNKSGAYTVMNTLGEQQFAKRIADANNLAPVYRASLQMGSNDVYGRVIYSSAFNTRAWLNPDPDRVRGVFTQSIEDISSNRRNITSVAGDTVTRLQQIY